MSGPQGDRDDEGVRPAVLPPALHQQTFPGALLEPEPGGPLLPEAASPGACLVLLGSQDAGAIGRVLEIDGPVTLLGRAPDAGVRLEDHGISRHHARIERLAHGGYRLVDLGSTNGTYVNGVRVGAAVLEEGDRIQVGTVTTLRFSHQRGLHTGEERLRQALAAARVATWDWTAQSGHVSWGEQLDRMLDLPRGALSDRVGPLEELVHPEDRARVLQAFADSARALSPLELELRLVFDAFPPRWVELRGEVLCDEQGRAVRITGTVLDVHARKAHELEVRRQALLFENLFDGVGVLDRQGRVSDWNASAERMSGFARAEVVGQRLREVLRYQNADGLEEQQRAALERDGRWVGEVTVLTRDGAERLSELTAVALRGEGGSALGTAVLLRDITAQRRMESQLATVGALAAAMAHEINNPLSYISLNLNFLEEQLRASRAALEPGVADECLQVLRETREGTERIRHIVRDLNQASRGDRDEPPSRVDVGATLDFALKMAQPQLRQRAARVTRELGALPAVMGHSYRLSQVFLNLLINAAQALPEDPLRVREVAVRTRTDAQGRAVVEILDSGVGIPEDVLPRIFDPFFTTKPQGRGTGLGLAICHGIVTSLGGSIEVESRAGDGSCFRVLLPPARAPVLPEPGAHAPEARARRAEVLVVDDEPMVAAAVRRLLAREHQVTVVGGAAEALALLRSGRAFDLVLCDVMMPHVTGMDLFEQLEQELPEVAERVVFMTGGAFTPRTTAFLDAHRDRVLGKPLDVTAVRRLLRERGGGGQRAA